MWKFYLFLCVASLQAESPNLQSLWQQEIVQEDLSSNSDLLKDKHVLFVGGMLNELFGAIRGYFYDNCEAVDEELGGESSHFRSSSWSSIPQNAEMLHVHVLKTYFENQSRPITLVGHSKGAAEILHLVLEHPELVLEGLVERIVLIQAAVQGSPAANDPSKWFRSSYGHIKDLVGIETHSLSETGSKAIFDALFTEFEAQVTPPERQLISDKIFYVRSVESPEKHSYSVQLILEITQHSTQEYLPCDGMIPVHAQLHPRIGVDLGIVQSDHLSLVIPWVTAFSKKERKALTRTIFKLIFKN